MNISSRLVIWCCCFALFIAGVIWSAIFYDLQIEFLKDVVEACSFVATIIAAGVAVSTLTAWRKQWKYSAIQDALKRLTTALDDLSCVQSYLRVYSAYHLFLAQNPTSENTKMTETLEDQLHLELKQATKDFISALQDAHLLCDSVVFSGFISDTNILSEKIVSATDAIRTACSMPGVAFEAVVAISAVHESALQGLMFESKKQVEAMRKEQLLRL